MGLSRFSNEGMTVGCIMSGRKMSGAGVPISTPKNSAGLFADDP